jgi:ketosteroid isomerase-like protein
MASPAEEVIRSAYDALNEGRADRVAELLPGDFTIVPLPGLGMPDRLQGSEGILRFLSDADATWQEMKIEIEEVVDLGQRIVVLGRYRNRGRGSGIEIDAVAAHLWTVEGGVPVRMDFIGDRDEALRRGRAEASADPA